MKIALYSDCHTELHTNPWFPRVSEGIDVIVLAGDIGVGSAVVEWVAELSEIYNTKDIIYIAGNHEFYGGRFSERLEYYREAFSSLINIHFLEKDTVEINGVRFLGCTLWTDFMALGIDRSDVPDAVLRCLADFHCIKMDGGSLIQPSDMSSMQKESVDWLGANLETEFEGETVVISHFPPLKELLHGIIGDNELAPYFLNDLSELMKLHKPKVWIYGHNHWNNDMSYEGVRVVSNQFGYPQESQAVIGYQSELIIEV